MEDKFQQIPDDKSLRLFQCIFEKGKYKNKKFTVMMKIMCDSPTCKCTDIAFILKETDNSEPKEYSFILDVVRKKINKNPEIHIPNRNNAFAEEFVHNLTKELWMDFYNFFREYKGELCRDYKTLKMIDVDFSKMEYNIEERSQMMGYAELFPYSAEIRCMMEDRECLLDDQYCLASDCNCYNVGLTIIELDKQDLKKPKVLSTILYDYIKNKWEPVNKGDTPVYAIENIILELKKIYPDFNQIFQNRHKTFRSIYAKYRKKAYKANLPIQTSQKTGRNEPCPCGSGKKYKKCCG